MANLLYLCNPFTRVRQPVENIVLQRPLSDFKDVVCARTGIQTQDQGKLISLMLEIAGLLSNNTKILPVLCV